MLDLDFDLGAGDDGVAAGEDGMEAVGGGAEKHGLHRQLHWRLEHETPRHARVRKGSCASLLEQSLASEPRVGEVLRPAGDLLRSLVQLLEDPGDGANQRSRPSDANEPPNQCEDWRSHPECELVTEKSGGREGIQKAERVGALLENIELMNELAPDVHGSGGGWTDHPFASNELG